MKIARLAGLMLVAVMALGLVAATTAFAEPEFHPIGAKFTGVGLGLNTLSGSGNTIVCEGNTTSGTISSATLVGGVVVTFTGCKSSSATGEKNCTAKSTLPLGAAGTIITNTLHGVLGLILPAGTGSGVGLLLLPATGKKFVVVESNKCTIEASITGNVAGEAKPIGGGLVLNGQLLFQAGTTGESIKDFDLSTGGLVVTNLEAFGNAASQVTTEDLDFSPLVEVS
jgi:hypothetical protein